MEQTETTEEFIRRQIESGYFDSREALIDAAVRRMQEEEVELDFLAGKMRGAAEQFKNSDRGNPPSLEDVQKRVAAKRAGRNGSNNNGSV